MSPKRRRSKTWSHTAGAYPHTVRVFEREPGGMLYISAWDGSGQPKVSLRHRDRELAIQHAEEEARKLREGSVAIAAAPTVGFVLMQYLVHRTPKKGINADGTLNPERQKAAEQEDRRRVDFWRRRLGASTQLRLLGPAEWESTITERMSGAIDAHGNPVLPEHRKPVSPRTVDADLVFMISVMNWATTWKVNGRPILDRNPWGAAAAGVKRSLERPKTLDPKRPIATYERFLKIRAAAELVMMGANKGDAGAELVDLGVRKFRLGAGTARQWRKKSYLPELLDLVHETGRRISAVCRLRYSDIVLTKGKPVAIKWGTIKGSKVATVPVNEMASAALSRILKERPGLGERWCFPSAKDPAKPITRYYARGLHRRAERIADVPHLPGGEFHPYRRTWATVRKNHPTADKMLAGGWEDPRSLNLYTLPDDESVIAVIEEPRRLQERKA